MNNILTHSFALFITWHDYFYPLPDATTTTDQKGEFAWSHVPYGARKGVMQVHITVSVLPQVVCWEEHHWMVVLQPRCRRHHCPAPIVTSPWMRLSLERCGTTASVGQVGDGSQVQGAMPERWRQAPAILRCQHQQGRRSVILSCSIASVLINYMPVAW